VCGFAGSDEFISKNSNKPGNPTMQPNLADSASTAGRITDLSKLLTADQLAKLLNISIRTLWRLRAGGKLPAPVRLGGSVRWRPVEIEAWLAAGCPDASANSRGSKSRCKNVAFGRLGV
jgi:excisionase family DNA binding protein